MFFHGGMPTRKKCLCFGLIMIVALAGPAHGQDSRKVPISFVPPPLENATYSLGIYEAKSGRLVRRVQEIAPESAFTVGLNGLITNWDGKDDEGKAVAPGRYAARGYAVGALKVEGVAVLGNDWAAADEAFRPIFIDAIGCPEEGDDLIVCAKVPSLTDVARFAGADGHLLWRRTLQTGGDGDHPGPAVPSAQSTLVTMGGDALVGIGGIPQFAFNAADGKGPIKRAPETSLSADRMRGVAVPGKDGTTWKIEDGELRQLSSTDDVLRRLIPAEGEPRCEKVAASLTSDKLYILERLPSANWERVRGLVWTESKEEDGKRISTWQTFFERNIGPPDAALFLGNPLTADRTGAGIEVSLENNPLAPGKRATAKLAAVFDGTGSYLMTSEGLRLRRISENSHLRAVRVAKGKTANGLVFYQSDGAAWDEFSIEGVKRLMEFDAGEFEMTAQGEKTHSEKPTEPPDL